jgi:hypothetical protein
MATTIEVSDPVDWVELTKRLMMVMEHRVDESGQIVFLTGCRHFSKHVYGDDGLSRGIAFGIEEMEQEQMR